MLRLDGEALIEKSSPQLSVAGTMQAFPLG
jgi:hypothetical protein